MDERRIDRIYEITRLRNELAFLASDPRPPEIVEKIKADIRRQIAEAQAN